MTGLRKRFIEDLQLKGYSVRTQQMYVRAVRQLAEHYSKSPDQITEEELRDYFLYNRNIRKWSRTASTISLCGIKFFFEQTLHRPWTALSFVRPPKEKKLPVVLSIEEVRRVLHNVHMDRHRVCLLTIYSCGLRLLEGTHLKISDIDSSRMFLHIKNAKGNKDRLVPLPQRTLELLREWWKTHRNMASACCPAINGPCRTLSNVAHLPWAEPPIIVRTVQLFTIATTRARIDIVRNVRMMLPMTG